MMRFLRWLVPLLLVIGSAVRADAQAPSLSAQLSSTSCPGAGCANISVQGLGGGGVTVSGTWVGTLTFEVASDGINYTSILLTNAATGAAATTTTGTGAWNGFMAGYGQFRVRFSAYTSGTALVTLGAANGGTSGTTCGTNTQVCFNDAGVISGDSAFTYTKASDSIILNSASTGTTILDLRQPDDTPYILTLTNGMFGTPIGFYVSNAGILNVDGTGITFQLPVVLGSLLTTSAQIVSSYALGNTQSAAGLIVNDFNTTVTETDLAASNILTGTRVVGNFGSGGVASVGTFQNFVSALVISGSGSASNEFSVSQSVMDVRLGTGYTQTAGPTGRFWLRDDTLAGPTALQPNALNGNVLLLKNFYNGSPADSPSGGQWLTTLRGPSATYPSTYVIDVGLGIVGFSNTGAGAGTDALGFTTALQIGGFGSPWGETKSLIGTGIDISQYATRGLYFHAATGTPTAAIEVAAGAGAIVGRYVANGSAPAVAGTTMNSCGTSAPSVVGNDNAFKVTVGATAGTSCTVTFQTAFAAAPSCTVTNETTANLLRATSTTSTVILAGTMVAGDVLSGACMGR